MKKKEMLSSVRWNGKNRIYLQRLGFLDPRTGKVKEGQNLSGFINECVCFVCEQGMHVRNGVASPEELRRAWLKFKVKQLYDKIDGLRGEVSFVVGTHIKGDKLRAREVDDKAMSFLEDLEREVKKV